MMMIMIWTPLPLSSLARPLLEKFLDPYISMQYPGYSSMMWAAIAYIVLVKQQPATQLSLFFSLKCHSNSIPINDATCQLSWYFQASGKPDDFQYLTDCFSTPRDYSGTWILRQSGWLIGNGISGPYVSEVIRVPATQANSAWPPWIGRCAMSTEYDLGHQWEKNGKMTY